MPVSVYTADDTTKLADGQLLTPNNAIDTSTGTIQLKATFANDNDALWPGEFVNARLRIDTLHNAVTVPIAAIQHGPNGLFVYTVKPDNTVQEQDVRIAYQDNDTAVISQGVKGDDTVVLTGQSRLSPGTQGRREPRTPKAARRASRRLDKTLHDGTPASHEHFHTLSSAGRSRHRC